MTFARFQSPLLGFQVVNHFESNFWFDVFVNDCPSGPDHGDRIFRLEHPATEPTRQARSSQDPVAFSSDFAKGIETLYDWL